jgi:hypothetical protein
VYGHLDVEGGDLRPEPPDRVHPGPRAAPGRQERVLAHPLVAGRQGRLGLARRAEEQATELVVPGLLEVPEVVSADRDGDEVRTDPFLRQHGQRQHPPLRRASIFADHRQRYTTHAAILGWLGNADHR